MPEPAPQSVEREPTRPRRRRLRRWLAVLLAAAVLLVVLVALLPTLLSTGPGNALLLSVANRFIPGMFEADRIQLGWSGGLRVSQATLRDPDGAVVIDHATITADELGVLDALRQTGLGSVTVEIDRVDVIQPAGQRTNLEAALLWPDAEEPEPAPLRLPTELGLELNVAVREASYRADDQPTSVLRGLRLDADLGDTTTWTAAVTGTVERDGVTGSLQGNAALRDFVSPTGELNVNVGTLTANLQLRDAPVQPLDGLLGLNGKLHALLGDGLQVDLDVSGTLAAPTASVDLDSPRFNARFRAAGARDETGVRLTEPATLKLLVTPDAVAGLLPDGAGVEWLEPFEVDTTVTALALPTADGRPILRHAELDVAIASTTLAARLPDGRTIKLDGPRFDAATQSADTLGISARLRADALLDDERHAVLLDLAVSGLFPASDGDGEEGWWKMGLPAVELSAERLPLTLIETLAGQPNRLATLFGDDATVAAALRPRADGSGQAELRFQSELASAMLDARWQDHGKAGRVSTPRGANDAGAWVSAELLEAWLGKAAYAALPVQLAQPTQASVRVNELRWAFNESADGGWVIDPLNTAVDARIRLPQIALRRADTGEALPVLTGFRTAVNASSLSDALGVRGGVNLTGVADQAEQTPGVTWRIGAQDLIDADGAFAWRAATFGAELTGRDLPTSLLDALLNQAGQLVATLGPTLTPSATVDWKGGQRATADIDVRSTYATGMLRLAEDLTDEAWSPTLREDPSFTLAVSEGAVQSWLGALHPVFADVLRSAPDAPAKLTLTADTFVLPVSGEAFDLKEVRADATLEPGVLEMDRRGWLRQGITGIVRRFRPDFGRGGPVQTYRATFSPLRVSLRDGMIETSEMWLTADDMGVGFAGRVDLNDNTLDMGVGLLGATLIAAWSDLDEVVEPGQVYELPIEGTADSPRLGVARFIGQLGTAYGRREITRNSGRWFGDDRAGRVIGGVLEDAIQGLLQWDNPRRWSPSENANAFAVSVAEAMKQREEDASQPQPDAGSATGEQPGAGADPTPAEPDPDRADPPRDEPRDLEDQLEEAGWRLLEDLLRGR